MELNCAVELPVDINIDIFLMFTFVFLYPWTNVVGKNIHNV